VLAKTFNRLTGSLLPLASQIVGQSTRLGQVSAIPAKMAKDRLYALRVIFHARDRIPQSLIEAFRPLGSRTGNY